MGLWVLCRAYSTMVRFFSLQRMMPREESSLPVEPAGPARPDKTASCRRTPAEPADFQLNGHQTTQTTVKQQQVDEELLAVDLQPILIAHEGNMPWPAGNLRFWQSAPAPAPVHCAIPPVPENRRCIHPSLPALPGRTISASSPGRNWSGRAGIWQWGLSTNLCQDNLKSLPEPKVIR